MTLDEYVEHLLAGEDDLCLAEGRALAKDLNGLHRLYVDLIAPSQYRVGKLWEGGRISVAAEHLATATNSYVASSCYAPLARESSGGPRALVACTPEEMHDLGPRLLSDLLETDGWDVDFYGTSMPARDLIGAISERKPRVVGLSVALVMHLGGHRGAARSEGLNGSDRVGHPEPQGAPPRGMAYTPHASVSPEPAHHPPGVRRAA